MVTAAKTDLRLFFSPYPHPHLFPRNGTASCASLVRSRAAFERSQAKLVWRLDVSTSVMCHCSLCDVCRVSSPTSRRKSCVCCAAMLACERNIVASRSCVCVPCCSVSQAERDAALRESHKVAEQLREQLVRRECRQSLLRPAVFARLMASLHERCKQISCKGDLSECPCNV
jgi:hypothetical protein